MPSELLNLDERFGTCIDPTRVHVHDCERLHPQRSLFRLDDAGAARLRRIIEAVEAAFYLSHCIISEFSLLWVIDKDGSVVMALEEGMNERGVATFPLPRGLDRPAEARKLKLGHPALVNCQPARIGGELNFFPGEPNGPWFLSNRSGRFGTNLGRTEEQLEAAVALFQRQEIPVQRQFVG